jgi:hypothetical protein
MRLKQSSTKKTLKLASKEKQAKCSRTKKSKKGNVFTRITKGLQGFTLFNKVKNKESVTVSDDPINPRKFLKTGYKKAKEIQIKMGEQMISIARQNKDLNANTVKEIEYGVNDFLASASAYTETYERMTGKTKN